MVMLVMALHYAICIAINDQIIAQAEADAPQSGYDTKSYFVMPTKDSGLLDIADASTTEEDASMDQVMYDASIILRSPKKDLYVGYMTGDGLPPNGSPYGFGLTFPDRPTRGEFYLRTDYMPNRLFRYDGNHWLKFEDNVRMTLNNFGAEDVAGGVHAGKAIRETQKFGFINNTNTSTIAGQVIPERQALSKALKPKADN
jgi:hypothetical protein